MGAVMGLMYNSVVYAPDACTVNRVAYGHMPQKRWIHVTYYEFHNSFHPSLKFSIERTDTHQNQIPFLDTLLTVQASGAYTTGLYITHCAAQCVCMCVGGGACSCNPPLVFRE